MNKKFLLILVASLLAFVGCEKRFEHVIIDDRNVTTNNNQQYERLVQRYAEYWDCMSKKDFDCAYRYEMPYQRFLHDLHWYKSFNRNNDQNYKIILLGIIPKEENKVLVKSKFISNDKKVTYVFYDKWYNVDDEWFHRMKVSLLPFGVNNEE